MEISKKAVEKLKERTATANACGVRLFLTQFGCSGYKYDLKLEYKKPTLKYNIITSKFCSIKM